MLLHGASDRVLSSTPPAGERRDTSSYTSSRHARGIACAAMPRCRYTLVCHCAHFSAALPVLPTLNTEPHGDRRTHWVAGTAAERLPRGAACLALLHRFVSNRFIAQTDCQFVRQDVCGESVGIVLLKKCERQLHADEDAEAHAWSRTLAGERSVATYVRRGAERRPGQRHWRAVLCRCNEGVARTSSGVLLLLLIGHGPEVFFLD